MVNLLSLYPVLSIVVLQLYRAQQTMSGMVLAGLLSLGSLILLPSEIIPFGLAYALFYGSLCVFPFFLERKNLRGMKERHIHRELLKKKNEELKSLVQHCTFRADQLSLEIEKVLERYNFAKVLVSQTEEKSFFSSLLKIFEKVQNVDGIAFFSQTQEPAEREGKIGELVIPEFCQVSSKQLLEQEPSLSALRIPLDSMVCQPLQKEKGHSPFCLSIPIKWGEKLHGVLLFLLRRPAKEQFLVEVSRYAQFLGLGFQKAELYRTMVERSRRDGLTQLYLRRIFLERLNEEIALSKRYGTSFSLLMLDLDHFKSVNDTYGHLAGDAVLQNVSAVLRETLHPGVMICRYGGEEFAVLIGLAPAEEVLKIAETVRRAVENKEIGISEGRKIRITVSIGAAHYLPDAPLPAEFIRRADVALYHAKESGRNCVREWGSLER